MTIAIIILSIIVVIEFLALVAFASGMKRLEDRIEYVKRLTNDNHAETKEKHNDLLNLVNELAKTQGYQVEIKYGVEFNPFARLFKKPCHKHIEELHLEKVKKLKVKSSVSERKVKVSSKRKR